MQLVNSVPGIWVFSTMPDYNSLRGDGYGSFLSPRQQARVERIRQARMLFDGQHREYYLWEGRTQFDFPQVRAGYRIIQRYLRYNVLGLIALKGTDLLLGEAPTFKVSDPLQEQYLQELIDRTALRTLLFSSALQASYEAEAFIEATVWNWQAYLESIPADEIFPVGTMNPDGQFSQYIRYRVTDIGAPGVPLNILLKVTYSAGSIARECWQLGKDGKPQNKIGLENWPVDPGQPPLAPLTMTGINRNTITWIPNWVVRGQAVSDFDNSLDLQDMLNAKQTQLADVIAKHANPKLAAHADSADEQGNLRASEEVFWFRNKDAIAQYIELGNSQIDNAMKDRDAALANLLVTQEMTPVLLGLREGNHNDAYKKVKVQAMPTLKKAERKSVYWQVGIKRMISVVQDLECTLPGYYYPRLPIGVQTNDGIPMDELDDANRLAILRGAGLKSLKRGVEEQYDDPATAAEELEEIVKENAASAPTVFMGTQMPGNPQGDQTIEAGEETAATAAAGDERAEVAA